MANRFQRTIRDGAGNVAAAVAVTVTDPVSGDPVTIYSDEALTSVKANPGVTDANGRFDFWAADTVNLVDVTAGEGVSAYTLQDVLIGVPQSQPYQNRAAAEAANIPATVTRILVAAPSGDTLAYVRDASGTALTTADGGNWSPDGLANLFHYGGVADCDLNNPGAATSNDAAFAAMIAANDNWVIPEGVWAFDADHQFQNTGTSGRGLGDAPVVRWHSTSGWGLPDGGTVIALRRTGLAATDHTITGITLSSGSPVGVTLSAPHGLTTGSKVRFRDVGGVVELNPADPILIRRTEIYTVTVTGASTVTLDSTDGADFTAWTSGGIMRHTNVDPREAAFRGKDNCVFANITFVETGQNMVGGVPLEFPPIISGPLVGTAFNISIEDIRFSNAYIGVHFVDQGSFHNLRRINGFAIMSMTMLSGYQAAPTLQDMEQSAGLAYTETARPANSLDRWAQDNAATFVFGDMDWPKLSRLFSIAVDKTYYFANGGATSDLGAVAQATLVSCSADECHTPVYSVSPLAGLKIIGGTFSAGSKYAWAGVPKHFDISGGSAGTNTLNVCGLEMRGGVIGEISANNAQFNGVEHNTSFATADQNLLVSGCASFGFRGSVRCSGGIPGIVLDDVSGAKVDLDARGFGVEKAVVLRDGAGITDRYDINVVSDGLAANAVDETAVSAPDGFVQVVGTDTGYIRRNGVNYIGTTTTDNVEFQGHLRLDSARPTLTIAAGVITVTGNLHRVSPESGSADDLTNADGTPGDGALLYLTPASSSHTITIKHNAGAATGKFLMLSDADFVLSGFGRVAKFVSLSGNWWQV